MTEPINAVVVGIGGRGAWMAEQVARSPRFSLCGLCDLVPARARTAAGRIGDQTIRVYEDYGACLADCDFDAVFICTHDGAHADIAVPSLAAGKFVFVEKPLEITAARCDAVIAADRRAGGRTSVGHNLREAPVYAAIRRMLDRGAIGDVLTIEANEFYTGGRTYFRRWNRLRSMGGGLWITKACHDFDILHWMAGSKPVSVAAFDELSHYRPRPEAAALCRDCPLLPDCPDSHFRGTPAERSALAETARTDPADDKPDLCVFNSDKDTFDHGSAVVKFANGVTACYTVNVVSSFTRREIRVSGTEGCLEGDLETGELIHYRRDPEHRERIDLSRGAAGGHGGGDEHILDSFAEFACGRDADVVRPETAAVAVRMGLAATLAADENRVVRMVEIGAEDE